MMEIVAVVMFVAVMETTAVSWCRPAVERAAKAVSRTMMTAPLFVSVFVLLVSVLPALLWVWESVLVQPWTMVLISTMMMKMEVSTKTMAIAMIATVSAA